MIRLKHARLLATLLGGDPASAAPVLATFDAAAWTSLLADANEDLLSPELSGPLGNPALADLVPPNVAAHLTLLSRLNARRNTRIGAQLKEIVLACGTAGLRPLLLKGARAFAGDVNGNVARVMIDLDLLFPRDELVSAVVILGRLGYRRLDGASFGGAHIVGYFARVGEPALIDLHHEPLVASHLLPASALLARARPASAFGAPVLVADAADEVFLAVLHAMVQDMAFRHGTASIRRLRDIAVRMSALGQVDWEHLKRRASQAQADAPLAVALRLVAWVFGPQRLPEAMRTRSLMPCIAVWRLQLISRGLMPRSLNVAMSRIINAWASHNHRPREDGHLAVWRARRIYMGFRLLFHSADDRSNASTAGNTTA